MKNKRREVYNFCNSSRRVLLRARGSSSSSSLNVPLNFKQPRYIYIRERSALYYLSFISNECYYPGISLFIVIRCVLAIMEKFIQGA